MGRCQSGFCSPRTMEILARECGMSMFDITKSGGKSQIVVGNQQGCIVETLDAKRKEGFEHETV